MFTARITKKGQVTIPAEFRKRLNSNIVKIEMEGDRIIIKPYRRLGGIFHRYAIKDRPVEEIMKMEKEAYLDAIKERHSVDRR